VARTIGWLALMAGSVLFPAVGMFVLPAALLWALGSFRSLDRFTRAIYCIFFGISCWTWLPWLTRYVPISLSSLIWVVVLALAGILVFLAMSHKRQPRRPTRRLGKSACLVLAVLTAVIMLARLLPAIYPNVPPGVDMSMHTYYARMVMDSNGIPQTHRPFLPIDSFGEYPIGFALLIACTSLISGLEVQTGAMLWTCLTYVLLTFGLFLLLRVWFSPVISLSTAAISAFLAASPQIYSEGGGNPTVLSFAFILAALGLFFRLSRYHSFLELLVQASLWAAALLTHSIPFLGATYFLVAFALGFSIFAWASKRLHELRAYAGRCILVFVVALLLVSPFIAGFSPHISDKDIEFSKSWQRDRGHSWKGTIQDSLWTIPQYTLFTFKKPFVYIVLLGLLISTLSWRMRLSIFLCALVPIGLVVNSQYWVLPFSYALYPERMAMMLIAPMALLLGGLVDRLVGGATMSASELTLHAAKSLRQRVSKMLPLVCTLIAGVVVVVRAVSELTGWQWGSYMRIRYIVPLVLALLIFEAWSFLQQWKVAIAAIRWSVTGIAVCFAVSLCWNGYSEFYLANMKPQGSVAQDDLRAFEWIKRNTAKTDIILNVPEHDYSGLWIPAICARRILWPHTNALYFDELQKGNEGAVAAYAFLGSRPHANGSHDPAVEAIRNSRTWRKVASFGRAEVYERYLVGPGRPPPKLVGPSVDQ